VAGGRREQQSRRPATTEKEPWNAMITDNTYFIFVTDNTACTLDGVDICRLGEREHRASGQSVQDLALQAAQDYLVGMYEAEAVRVWVLAPDKSVTSYTVTVETVYNIDKD
jgi:hypothetical protein